MTAFNAEPSNKCAKAAENENCAMKYYFSATTAKIFPPIQVGGENREAPMSSSAFMLCVSLVKWTVYEMNPFNFEFHSN